MRWDSSYKGPFERDDEDEVEVEVDVAESVSSFNCDEEDELRELTEYSEKDPIDVESQIS